MSECMENEKTCDNFDLIKAAQEGDRKAMDQLITQNMGLVKTVARRFIGRSAEYEELSFELKFCDYRSEIPY